MRRTPKTVFALLMLALMPLAHSTGIDDAPVKALEPGLEVDALVPGEMAWLDGDNLMVTAKTRSSASFWERKVMRVDVRTGATTELFPQGAVACANPVDGSASVHVGSFEAHYKGGSQVPLPVLTTFQWKASTQQLAPIRHMPDEHWNAWLCMRTDPVHVNTPPIGFIQSDVRYLGGGDGHELRFTLKCPDHLKKEVRLVRAGKTLAKPDLAPIEVAPRPGLPALPRRLPAVIGHLLHDGHDGA
jgi:hypothetical protein